MIEQIKKEIKTIIETKFNIEGLVVEDGKIDGVDISVPLFVISKKLRQNPKLIFDEIKPLLKLPGILNVEFLNGFLNINLNRKSLGVATINSILAKEEKFGDSQENKNEIILIDYSSPNIAKSFGIGHLRSTVIGNSIKKLYQKTGAKVIGINHLGDWGTQFGKMIVAYKLWGDKEVISKDPINELQKLYVKFHDLEKNDKTLEQQGRDAFKALEENDPEMVELWSWFKEESLKEFMNIYDELNVSFDSYDGESFYNDKMDEVINLLEKKNLTVIDDGATIVSLDEFDLPPALIKRSDGATLYMTRDLAAVNYRRKKYQYTKALYVVGNEQKLHFRQLEEVAKKLDFSEPIEHIGFGLVMIDGKKMSTRGGKFKRLEDVLNQAVSNAYAQISEKNPTLENKEAISKAIGIGAIVFNDLKNDRNLNIDFNLENMLKFEGQTGPYLQYSSVRIASILKDQQINESLINDNYFTEDHYYNVIKRLANFPNIISRAANTHNPSILAKYLINLSQDFNHFYGRQKILVDDIGHLNTNLSLIKAIRIVLNEGMNLLGITALDEM